MFGIGMPELLLILAVALIVIGPKKLPDLARSLGKAMGEFKRATNDLKQTIENETGLDDVRNSINETRQDLRKTLNGTDAYPNKRPDGTSVKDGAEASSQSNTPNESDTAPSTAEKRIKDSSQDSPDQPKENGGS